MTSPTQKTNEEILDSFNLRPQYMPHSENVKFLKKVLEIKDEQARIEMIEMLKYLEQQMYDIDPKKKERIISRLLTKIKNV